MMMLQQAFRCVRIHEDTETAVVDGPLFNGIPERKWLGQHQLMDAQITDLRPGDVLVQFTSGGPCRIPTPDEREAITRRSCVPAWNVPADWRRYGRVLSACNGTVQLQDIGSGERVQAHRSNFCPERNAEVEYFHLPGSSEYFILYDSPLHHVVRGPQPKP